MSHDKERTHIVNEEGQAASSGTECPYLVALTGPDAGQTFRLKDGVFFIGRAKGAHIRVADDDVSRQHARILCQAGNVVVEDLQSRNGTFVNEERVVRKSLADGDKVSVGDTTILKFSLREEIDEDFHERLFRAARRDALTGAFRRGYFEHRLKSELAFARRHHTSLAVFFIDLDHFKSVNDAFGETAGDRLLTEVAGLLHKQLRQEDLLCRYQGEEFAVLVHGVDLTGAAAVAERLRSTVAGHPFAAVRKPDFHLCISVGLVTYPSPTIETAETLVAAANAAMYVAKKRGGNRVVKHESA